ncbi:MAG: hypothetical protein NDI94_02390 [Candidatus Woesearchaeota archaeon]|nr:hypothetical protein [Candidatus Woesearchaeota archaeon]
MTDVNYYKTYDEYRVKIDPGEVDKFVDALLFYLDTGLTNLESRVHGDIRGFRAGFICEGQGLNVYRVLTAELSPEGMNEDYAMIEMVPDSRTLNTDRPEYALRILPNEYFLHKVDCKLLERLKDDNRLMEKRPVCNNLNANTNYLGFG